MHLSRTVRHSLTLCVALLTSMHCSGDRAADTQVEDELERLRALGYVGFTNTAIDPDADPVTHFDAQRSEPGYNLISNRDLTSAQLFDARGEVVRAWQDPGANHWSNAELLANGDLLVTGSEQADPTGSNFLLRMNWNGEVIWRRTINAHHDAEITPQLVLAFGIDNNIALKISRHYKTECHSANAYRRTGLNRR